MASLRARARGVFGGYTEVWSAPECNCNCCISEPRRPAEVHGKASMMCATPPIGDPRLKILNCPYKCTVVNDPILPTSHVVVLDILQSQSASRWTTMIKAVP